jgi:predicted TIM-barrel fold metal-dependent hydrolase
MSRQIDPRPTDRPAPTSARRFGPLGGPCSGCGLTRRSLVSGMAAMATGSLWPGPASKAQGGAGRVDVHRHFTPPGYVVDPVRSHLNDRSTVARQIEDMDQGGVALAVNTMIVPDLDLSDRAAARRYSRLANEYAAKLAADHPGRFGSFAYLPFPDIEGTLKEIEYAFDTLKADGVFLWTHYDDKFLGDPVFAPVFEELNRRDAVVYTHPRSHSCCVRLVPGLRDADIEFATNTTRAIAKMVFSGASRRYPRMRMIWSHAGGTMPFLVRRFIKRVVESPEFQPVLPEGFVPEARKFYYDVAQAPDQPSMASLRAVVPVSQILFGTDYPYLGSPEHVAGLAKSGVFSDSELAAVGRDNALRLMPSLRPA